MKTMAPVEIHKRAILNPLFERCRYDRVLIDSVLEGHFGRAYADSAHEPRAARLDSGTFTMLAGDPDAAGVDELLHAAPIVYVTPQDHRWRQKLEEQFHSRISILEFTDFSPTSVSLQTLRSLINGLGPEFVLKRVDHGLAEKMLSDIGNEYFFENYHSIDDFLGRGVGFCILHHEKMVTAATATAQSNHAIDIEIETVPTYQRRGLGAAVGAKLVSTCLKAGIVPRWLAANNASEQLALKLGYTKGETYSTFEISQVRQG